MGVIAIKDKTLDTYIKEFHKRIVSDPEMMSKYEWSTKHDLAIIYRYLGETEKSKELFKQVGYHGLDTAGLPDARQEALESLSFLVGNASFQITKGIQLDLAGEHDAARQQFEWAAENCLIPEKEYDDIFKTWNAKTTALSYLRRGYALLYLGRYEEAYCQLLDAKELFKLNKEYGIELQFIAVDYYLPRLLCPLSIYKLNPTEDNRRKAIEGIDEFLDGFPEDYDKFNAYLYCLHAMEIFPDAYDETGKLGNVSKAPGITSIKDIKCKRLQIKINEEDRPNGTVIVTDRENFYSQVFGRGEDVYSYLDKVNALDHFTAIDRLIDWYCLEMQMESQPLIEDCKKILSMPGLDEDTRNKTEVILDVAKKAEKNNSKVMLYYDKEMNYEEAVKGYI